MINVCSLICLALQKHIVCSLHCFIGSIVYLIKNIGLGVVKGKIFQFTYLPHKYGATIPNN